MAARKEIPRELSIYINDKEVVNSFRGITNEITRTKHEMNNLNKNSENYNEEMAKLRSNLTTLTEKQSQFKNEIQGASEAMNESTGIFGKLKNAIGPVASGLLAAFSIGGVISAFSSAIVGAFSTINKFEQSVADLSSITGATGDNLEYLKQQAIDLGEKTIGGAIAVVEAYKLIASAKPELLENVEALNQVTEATLTLAQAAGMELPEAATALTDAMNQFNVPAEQASIFVDALANGAKYGAAEIPQITEALLKFGAVAKTSNIDIKESTALIELLAENGLKGAEAGTSLRNVLLKLSAPDALPKEARQEMERLGVSLEFLKDKSIPIQERLEILKPLLKDNASIVKVFGTENAAAAINIISHTDRLKELTSKMGEMGTASEQAAIKMDTVNNKTELLKSKYDSLILSIGSGSGVVSGFFKFFIDGASGALAGLIKLNSSVDELGGKSRKKGSDFSLKIFNVDKSKEELEQNRKEIAQEMDKTRIEIDKLKKDFNDRSILSSFNPFSKGTAVAKKEITELYNTLGQYEGAYKKIQSKLNPQKAQNTETVTNSGSSSTKSETQLQNDKKIETERLKADAKKKSEEEKAEKTRVDRLKEILIAKANLDKAEIENYLVNNRSKINAETQFTDEVIAEEVKRLEGVRNKKTEALEQEKADKVAKAELEIQDKTALKDTIEALDLEYRTKKQELDIEFDKNTYDLRKEAETERKEAEAEALLIQNEIDIAQSETDAELRIVQENQKYNNELIALDDRLRKGKLTEDQYRILRAKAEKDHSAAMIQITNAERDAKLMAMGELFGGIAKLLGENTKAGQIAALAEVAISQGLAVARIWEAKSTLPSPFDIAAKVGGTAVAIANVLAAATKIKNVKTPKFFYGGDTGNFPTLGHDEYGPMTGIVHKNEYVIPEVMTANPRFASTIAWLEQHRTGKVRKFVDGGGTSPGAIPTGTPDGAMVQNDMLYSVIANLNAILSNGITAKTIIGYAEAKDIQTLNDERNQSTSNGIISE